MATDFDNAFEGFAEEFLDESGISVTVNYNSGTFVPSTNSYSETTSAVTTTASPPIRFSEDQVDDTNIKRGDLQMIFAPEGLTRGLVEQKDTIEWDGDTYAIITGFPIVSGTLVAAYKYQLRKQ